MIRYTLHVAKIPQSPVQWNLRTSVTIPVLVVFPSLKHYSTYESELFSMYCVHKMWNAALHTAGTSSLFTMTAIHHLPPLPLPPLPYRSPTCWPPVESNWGSQERAESWTGEGAVCQGLRCPWKRTGHRAWRGGCFRRCLPYLPDQYCMGSFCCTTLHTNCRQTRCTCCIV